jgi:hypothetical protein
MKQQSEPLTGEEIQAHLKKMKEVFNEYKGLLKIE